MNTFLVVKFLHIVGALLVAVGSCGSLFAAINARRSPSARDAYTLMRLHHFTVTRGVIPGAIVSLLTGGYLVTLMGLPFTGLWILIGFGGWALSLALGVGLLVPAERRALDEGKRLLAAGDDRVSPALTRAMAAPHVWLAEWATVLLVVVMTWAMVFKPH